MKTSRNEHGFTLIELVIVVSILAILAGVMVPRLSERMAASRDARRLVDMKALKTAIEAYYADKGHYPAPQKNEDFGGWDVSHDGNFIQELRDTGFLSDSAQDPINDDEYHYRYYVYSQGSYGCQGSGPFFLLGVRRFETSEFTDEHRGFFKCKGRDWATTFAYVTGGGATFKE